MKALARKIGVAAALAAPFLLVLLIALEIFLRNNLQLTTGRFPCVTFDQHEGVTFIPSCRAEEETPKGKVSFQANEDGFRDRAQIGRAHV